MKSSVSSANKAPTGLASAAARSVPSTNKQPMPTGSSGATQRAMPLTSTRIVNMPQAKKEVTPSNVAATNQKETQSKSDKKEEPKKETSTGSNQNGMGKLQDLSLLFGVV